MHVLKSSNLTCSKKLELEDRCGIHSKAGNQNMYHKLQDIVGIRFLNPKISKGGPKKQTGFLHNSSSHKVTKHNTFWRDSRKPKCSSPDFQFQYQNVNCRKRFEEKKMKNLFIFSYCRISFNCPNLRDYMLTN
jgi:hypothetical protein